MMKCSKWLTARASILFEAMHAPETAFARSLEGPSYLVPLGLLGVGFVLLSFFQSSLTMHWAQRQMAASGAPPDGIAAALATMAKSLSWGFAAVPLVLFLKWIFFALTLWLSSQLFLADPGYSRILSIVAYSYSPILLRDAVILFILRMQGETAFNPPEGMNAAIGLNLLMSHLRLPWSMLAGNINLFECWYVILLASGLSRAAHFRRGKALTLVLANWLFALLLQFGLVALSLSVRSSLSR